MTPLTDEEKATDVLLFGEMAKAFVDVQVLASTLLKRDTVKQLLVAAETFAEKVKNADTFLDKLDETS